MGNIGMTEILMIALVALLSSERGASRTSARASGRASRTSSTGLKEAEEIDAKPAADKPAAKEDAKQA